MILIVDIDRYSRDPRFVSARAVFNDGLIIHVITEIQKHAPLVWQLQIEKLQCVLNPALRAAATRTKHAARCPRTTTSWKWMGHATA